METRMRLYRGRQTDGEWYVVDTFDMRGANLSNSGRGWFCLIFKDQGWKKYSSKQAALEASARKAEWPQ